MNETVIDLMLNRNCSQDCPFLRKIQDKHVYLCTEYRVFLEVDKYGLPRKNGRCGIKEVDNARQTLYALSKQLDNMESGVLTREDNFLLRNIISVLDNSEREAISQILNIPEMTQNFIKSFEKQPKDNELLANTRALIKEYKNKYLDKQKKQNRSRPEENKANETEEQMRMRLFLEKQREKSGRNGL